MPQHVRQLHRLVVVGGERVGKTAIIEQLLFGNHVVGQVRLFRTLCKVYQLSSSESVLCSGTGGTTDYWRYL